MTAIEILAVAFVAVVLLLICSSVTTLQPRARSPLRTRPLQVRDLGGHGSSFTPEMLAAAQQAASGSDFAPLQKMAQQVEANKAAAAAPEVEPEVLKPDPPLVDPEAEMRRRVARERLQSLARANPRAVGSLLQTWISERK